MSRRRFSDYVTGKLTRLERHYDHITNMHVVLSVEKLDQKAEATAHVSGAELFADATSVDLYAAIDMRLPTSSTARSSSTRKNSDNRRPSRSLDPLTAVNG